MAKYFQVKFFNYIQIKIYCFNSIQNFIDHTDTDRILVVKLADSWSNIDNKQNKDDDILFSYSNNSQIFDGVPNNLV
jgi:hypothetical protein